MGSLKFVETGTNVPMVLRQEQITKITVNGNL